MVTEVNAHNQAALPRPPSPSPVTFAINSTIITTPTTTIKAPPPPAPVIYPRLYIYITGIYTLHIRWVGVDWQRRCEARQSPRELDNHGTVFFLAVAMAGGRVRTYVRGGEPLLRTREMVSACMARHPRARYIVYPSLEVATAANKISSVDAVIHICFAPEVIFRSRTVGACPVTTDCIVAMT